MASRLAHEGLHVGVRGSYILPVMYAKHDLTIRIGLCSRCRFQPHFSPKDNSLQLWLHKYDEEVIVLVDALHKSQLHNQDINTRLSLKLLPAAMTLRMAFYPCHILLLYARHSSQDTPQI